MPGLHKGSAAGQSHWQYGGVLAVCLCEGVLEGGEGEVVESCFLS